MQQTSDPLIKTDHALRLGVGDMAKISNHNYYFFLNITVSRFYHDSLSCWFYYFVWAKYSQTYFPITKTNPFKVTKYKNEWWIFRPKWAEMGIFVLILHLHLADAFIQSDLHSGYTFFCQYVCSLGIEPTTFTLLTQCSTTEPQEHILSLLLKNKNKDTHYKYT